MQRDDSAAAPLSAAPLAAELVRRRTRAAKRPSVAALLKAAAAAGLKVVAIECSEEGVKVVVGVEHARQAADDGAVLDAIMSEQMGVPRLGGRIKRR